MTGAAVIVLGNPLIVSADDISTTSSAPATTTTTPTTSSTSSPSTTTQPSTTSLDPSTSTKTPTSTSPSSSTPTTTISPTSTAPKTTYTYDSTTGHWNSSSWTYDPTSATYQPTVTPVAPSPTSGTTGTQSTLDGVTSTAVANALNTAATSGDASVLKNTTAGSATSGDATSAATIINTMNSSLTSSSNQQAATFVKNIMGDVNGDILLQPMLLRAMLEANAQPSTTTTMNATTNTGATNNVTLGATSGNATVSGNTDAGNATSGNANTVADVVNVVNSMIAANKSFIGTINIYGNLNGDILIAPDFIPQLLASNASSNLPKPVGTASATSNNTQSIVNNIALAAKTGQSVVSGNTSAGNATSGTATTNTVIFNLTGHDIVASNSLLVFINVLGKWVGVIVDAPTGTTAAALGSGVTTNSVQPNLVVNATNTTQLTNNLDLSSQSGNATVSGNTKAGNATSGNATASANIANIANTTIGTSGWFGILFINVFGSWLGSFGIDTAAGNPIITRPAPGSKTVVPHVIDFIPRSSSKQAPATIIQNGVVTTNHGQLTSYKPASHSSTSTQPLSSNTSTAPAPAAPERSINTLLLIGSLVLIGGSLIRLLRVL